MPEEMNIINLPKNVNLAGRLTQSFALILLQALALHRCVRSVGRQAGGAMLRAALLLWRGEGVLITMGWVLPERGPAAGKLPASAAPRKHHSHLHLQRQRDGISVIATEDIQARGACFG